MRYHNPAQVSHSSTLNEDTHDPEREHGADGGDELTVGDQVGGRHSPPPRHLPQLEPGDQQVQDVGHHETQVSHDLKFIRIIGSVSVLNFLEQRYRKLVTSSLRR